MNQSTISYLRAVVDATHIGIRNSPTAHWKMTRSTWLEVRRQAFQAKYGRKPTEDEEKNWHPTGEDTVFGYPIKIVQEEQRPTLCA